MLRTILLWMGVAMFAVAAAVTVVYLIDMHRAYERVRGRSTVVSSPDGDIEYAEGGSGPDVLVVHGGGGGYDQGALLAELLLGDDFHWIAPSRFGYLGSSLPEGATWDDQAHAYARLIDRLGIEKVAVVALSQGGPSALLFAVLYPERVSSLTCLSCGMAPSVVENQAEADKKGRMLKAVFRYDFLYWSVSNLFRRQFLEMMGAGRSVVAGLTPAQQQFVDRIISYMNPASLRSAGAAFDNVAALPGARIATIKAPTLIVHARDDLLQLYHNAEFAAAAIPSARLMSFETGGHLVIGVERSAVQQALKEHIRMHASGL